MDVPKNLKQRIKAWLPKTQSTPLPAAIVQSATQSKGGYYEAMAEQHLQSHGLRTVAKNYRCRLGEVDLIMRDGATLVFVEVRNRKHSRYGTPVETVTYHKQRKIVKTALHYIAQHNLGSQEPIRFDVVGITEQAKPDINWVSNAFDATGF